MSTRDKVIEMLGQRNMHPKHMAPLLGIKQNSVSFHLSALKRDNLATSEKGIWRLTNGVERLAESVIVETNQDKVPAQPMEAEPPSIRLLLYAAREGIDEALARLDAVESSLLGRTESP
jgi:predicted transcriptional regulator